MSLRRTLPLLVSLLPMALACEPVIPEGRFACTTDEDCPPGLVCRTNVSRCYETGWDAGPERDAGSPRDDAGPGDAGSLDASSPDAGPPDSGTVDGSADAGPSGDAGP